MKDKYSIPILIDESEVDETEFNETSMFPELKIGHRVSHISGEILEKSLKTLITNMYRLLGTLKPAPAHASLSEITIAASLTAEGGFVLVGKVNASASNTITLKFNIGKNNKK